MVIYNTFSKFAHNFTVGFLKLLSSHPVHFVVRGIQNYMGQVVERCMFGQFHDIVSIKHSYHRAKYLKFVFFGIIGQKRVWAF